MNGTAVQPALINDLDADIKVLLLANDALTGLIRDAPQPEKYAAENQYPGNTVSRDFNISYGDSLRFKITNNLIQPANHVQNRNGHCYPFDQAPDEVVTDIFFQYGIND